MQGLLSVALWAMGMTACVLLAWAGRVRRATHTPVDCERLAPGSDRWEAMGWSAGGGEGLADACVLADGRVAVSMATTFQADRPRSCDVWDPGTRRWSRGFEVIPAAPTPAGPREASLPGGRRLVLTRHPAGARVEIEPGGVRLPELPLLPERFGASELRGGALVVVAGDARYALERGAQSWAETRLPQLREPRHSEVRLALADGTLVVAGGLLFAERSARRPAALARKVSGALGALGLVWLAADALRGPHPPQVWAVALGVVIGVLLFAALARRILKALAWR